MTKSIIHSTTRGLRLMTDRSTGTEHCFTFDGPRAVNIYNLTAIHSVVFDVPCSHCGDCSSLSPIYLEEYKTSRVHTKLHLDHVTISAKWLNGDGRLRLQIETKSCVC